MRALKLCAGLLLSIIIIGCDVATSTPTPQLEPTPSTNQQPEPTSSSDQQPEPTSTESPKLDMHDVLFVPEGHSLQRLDVYLPTEGAGPFPTILTIHGGGFRARNKNMYREIAGHLNQLGYAVVSTNYRFVPTYSYPAQVEDVFCALAWMYANDDDYGFDREHIFVWGGSAGGYLASMVAAVDTPDFYLEGCPNVLPESDWVRGAVIFYGLYDFTSLDGYTANDIHASLEPFWGAEYGELTPEMIAEMSPMSWVDGSEPPFLIIHGSDDQTIPSWMSENFAAELSGAGVEVELLLIDAGHAFELKSLSSPEMQQSMESIEAFLYALTNQ